MEAFLSLSSLRNKKNIRRRSGNDLVREGVVVRCTTTGGVHHSLSGLPVGRQAHTYKVLVLAQNGKGTFKFKKFGPKGPHFLMLFFHTILCHNFSTLYVCGGV